MLANTKPGGEAGDTEKVPGSEPSCICAVGFVAPGVKQKVEGT